MKLVVTLKKGAEHTIDVDKKDVKKALRDIACNGFYMERHGVPTYFPSNRVELVKVAE